MLILNLICKDGIFEWIVLTLLLFYDFSIEIPAPLAI